MKFVTLESLCLSGAENKVSTSKQNETYYSLEIEMLYPTQSVNNLRDDLQKKKSKKRDFVPLSVDPYPPTKKREVLIRDNFDLHLPPTHLIERGTFLKKKFGSQAHLY